MTLCELHAHRTDVRNRSVSKMAPAQLNLAVVCSQANVSIGTDNEAILTNLRKCGLWASIKNSNIGTGFCVHFETRRWAFRLGLFKIQDLLLWTKLRQAESFFSSSSDSSNSSTCLSSNLFSLLETLFFLYCKALFFSHTCWLNEICFFQNYFLWGGVDEMLFFSFTFFIVEFC